MNLENHVIIAFTMSLISQIISTITDTLIPLLYQCTKACSLDILGLLSQPHFYMLITDKTFSTKVGFGEEN